METETIVLTGEARYANVFMDNRDRVGYEGAYEDCNGAFTIELILDDNEAQKIMNSKSKVQPKDEEDGRVSFKFKRKNEIRSRKTGEIVDFLSGPPVIVDENKEDWGHDPETNPRYIGNGSKISVAIEVTPDQKRPSIVYTRLAAIQVLEHVEYTPSTKQQGELPF